MPHLDPEQAHHLLGRLAEPEAEIDLRGLTPEAALERLRALVDGPVLPGPRTYAVRIDPPVPGGGETLFKPVGRFLLAARRRNRIGRFSPLAEPLGGGYVVEIRED
jgi:hypothetical protein